MGVTLRDESLVVVNVAVDILGKGLLVAGVFECPQENE